MVILKNTFSRIPVSIQRAIRRSIDIVLTFGDSLVLPPSYEIEVIRDKRDEVSELVAALYLAYPDIPDGLPMVRDVVHSAIGESGFRAITELDAIWNIYLLALVIAAGPDIERARVPIGHGVVHSFRFNFRDDSADLYDPDFGWYSFCDAGREKATRYRHVLSMDIRSFSQTICCLRLERALLEACLDTDIVERIMSIVNAISAGVSGLPVGATSFGLLAELSLDSTDRMLLANGIEFVRYIDDFRIFAGSRIEAQRILLQVTHWLSTNSEFALQKGKTKMMTSEEFLTRLPAPLEGGDLDDVGMKTKFLRLRMHIDRHSRRRDASVDANQRLIQTFDVVGLLTAELRKPQININLVKRAARSIEYLEPEQRTELMQVLSAHLHRTGPVFQGVLRAYLEYVDSFDDATRARFADAVKALYGDRSHVMLAPANLSWAIRVLALDLDERSEKILTDMYRSTGSAGIRRDVIIAMSNGRRTRFIMDACERFPELSAWERRAVIVASHMLEDSVICWSNPPVLTEFEQIFKAWALERSCMSGGFARLPL